MTGQTRPVPSFWRSRITWVHLGLWLAFFAAIRFEVLLAMYLVFFTVIGNILGFGIPILTNIVFLVLFASERKKSPGIINMVIFLSVLLPYQIGATLFGLGGAAAH
jgi:hypothetical protein